MPHFPRLFLLSLPVCLVNVQALACASPQAVVFSCLTKKARQVEVCAAGPVLSYRYGQPGKTPELAFSVPRTQTTTRQWNGVGRWMSYAVSLPNGPARYTVFSGVDRTDEQHAVDAGIEVDYRGKTSVIACKADSVRHNMEDIELPLEP